MDIFIGSDAVHPSVVIRSPSASSRERLSGKAIMSGISAFRISQSCKCDYLMNGQMSRPDSFMGSCCIGPGAGRWAKLPLVVFLAAWTGTRLSVVTEWTWFHILPHVFWVMPQSHWWICKTTKALVVTGRVTSLRAAQHATFVSLMHIECRAAMPSSGAQWATSRCISAVNGVLFERQPVNDRSQLIKPPEWQFSACIPSLPWFILCSLTKLRILNPGNNLRVAFLIVYWSPRWTIDLALPYDSHAKPVVRPREICLQHLWDSNMVQDSP